jgi:hypothetical protein
MKKLLITSSVIPLLLISCTKEKLTVMHKWKANSIKVNGIEGINTAPTLTNVIYDFKADGILKMYSDSFPESNGGYPATYVANETNVVITDSVNVTTYEIIGISINSLNLSGSNAGYTYDLAFDRLN